MRVLGAWCWIFAVCISTTFGQGDSSSTFGNYRIKDCDQPQVERLQAYLGHIQENILDKVIPDLKLGISSPHGLSAFFKTNDNIAMVRNLLVRIAVGSNIVWPGMDTPPTLVCSIHGRNSVQDYVCSSPTIVGAFVVVPGTSELFICPIFFDLMINEDALPIDCPRMRRGILTPNTIDLTWNHQGILVHELAHLYGVYNPAAPNIEVMKVSDAVRISPGFSSKNAQNYAFYYSCKYLSIPEDAFLVCP